jgi:hypothetical protein
MYKGSLLVEDGEETVTSETKAKEQEQQIIDVVEKSQLRRYFFDEGIMLRRNKSEKIKN